MIYLVDFRTVALSSLVYKKPDIRRLILYTVNLGRRNTACRNMCCFRTAQVDTLEENRKIYIRPNKYKHMPAICKHDNGKELSGLLPT